MNQEITCPKCSYQFALDQALNREIELQMRKQLREEFERKESDLRQQLAKEAAERTERNSAELQIKLEAQTRELKEARENERALLRTKAELQEQAEKAELEAQRKLSDERDKIRKAAQDQVIEDLCSRRAPALTQNNLMSLTVARKIDWIINERPHSLAYRTD